MLSASNNFNTGVAKAILNPVVFSGGLWQAKFQERLNNKTRCLQNEHNASLMSTYEGQQN
jgi:hypothetical protein